MKGIPSGVPEDPSVREEEWLRSRMAADPDVGVFYVRLRWRRGSPYLVLSSTPAPEMLHAPAPDSEVPFFGPLDIDMVV